MDEIEVGPGVRMWTSTHYGIGDHELRVECRGPADYEVWSFSPDVGSEVSRVYGDGLKRDDIRACRDKVERHIDEFFAEHLAPTDNPRTGGN